MRTTLRNVVSPEAGEEEDEDNVCNSHCRARSNTYLLHSRFYTRNNYIRSLFGICQGELDESAPNLGAERLHSPQTVYMRLSSSET